MPQNTPNRAYTYPLYGDAQDFPADIQELAEDIDLDVQALVDQIDGALNRPSVDILSGTNQAIPVNTTTALTWSTTDYDNDAMANLPAGIRLVDDGIYLLIARVALNATATAGITNADVAFTSSAGFITTPSRMSMHGVGTDIKVFNIFALHYTDGSVVDNIGVTVRHSDALGLNASARNLSASKVSNLLSGS